MKTLLQILFFLLLITNTCLAQWVHLGLDDKGIRKITARNSTIFTITSDSAVYRSTNNGVDWSQIVESSAIDIAISSSGSLYMVRQYIQRWSDSLFRSSDNGNTWVNITEQLPEQENSWPTNVTVSPSGIVFCGLYLFTGRITITHLALSTDDGSIWTSPGWEVIGGHLFDFKGQSVITSGYVENIVPSSYIHLSTDNGQTWSLLGETYWGNNSTLGIGLNGNIFVGGGFLCYPPPPGCSAGLFLSSDSCGSWTKISSLTYQAGISIESGGMLVVYDSLGVFLFSDDGDSIGSFNQGLSDLATHTLTIDNNGFVYVGTDHGVWRRPVSEIVSVERVPTALPSNFNLLQNYPNPFNPSTSIKYSIPQTSKVVIKIYDILGNEIATLMDEEKSVGTYELMWDASAQPSGVYFYQLKAGDYVNTKKMILLR